MMTSGNTHAITPEYLKSLAFDMYLELHNPIGEALNSCPNFTNENEDLCLDQPDVKPCPSCTIYARLLTEFNAIAVG